MKAFDHDLMTITVLGAFGCIEGRARPWDTDSGKFSCIKVRNMTKPLTEKCDVRRAFAYPSRLQNGV